MRLYQFGKLGSLDALKLREAEVPRPGAGQVVVRIRACSLNHRDLNIISGNYSSVAIKPEAIPLSDGAGEVAAVGQGVTRWKVGDRVAPIFVQRWLGGNLLPAFWGRQVESSVPQLIRETGMRLITDRFVRQGFYPSRVLVAENAAAHGRANHGRAARNGR